MHIETQKSLTHNNTFHIDAVAEQCVTTLNENDVIEILKMNIKPTHVIGGGSNILFTKNLDGITILNAIKGIRIIEEQEAYIDVEFKSGEIWHDCVLWAVQHNYGGIENLSLIPGTIGAAPIQNIGAYGVELKDVFVQLEALHTNTLEKKIFTNIDCRFDYRESIFKQTLSHEYFILSVTLRLQKKPLTNIQYGNIKEELVSMGCTNNPSIQEVSKAIINIRSAKLPNPAEIGNAGSFFKNPIISLEHFETLRKKHIDIPHYHATHGVKIPAGWLIEKQGWKGYTENDLGVHKHQALVLVNYKHAKGIDIYNLSQRIILSVEEGFGITLQREVNILVNCLQLINNNTV